MNLNFKILCSVAALMCSVPAVFGMQEGKMSFSDESAKSYSEERLIEVNEDPKLSDKQEELKKQLESARQERESARKDVENFGWLYNDALDRIKSADKRTKIIAELFGEAACLKQGISQDKEKAEQDAEKYLELFQDAKNREKNAGTSVDTLTQMLGGLEVSNQANADEVEPLSDSSMSSDNDEYDKEVQRWMKKNPDPMMVLFLFCDDKNNNYSRLDLKRLESKRDDEKGVKRILTVKDKVYDPDIYYPNNRMATKEIVRYALKDMVRTIDRRDSIDKFKEYLQDKNTKYGLSDVEYIFDINKKGKFNCKIRLCSGNESEAFNLKLSCKSKKEAQRQACAYALKILKEGESANQASSSDSNQKK